jgi:hypothetical protein
MKFINWLGASALLALALILGVLGLWKQLDNDYEE